MAAAARAGDMILTVRLLPREAKALTEMCKRFCFDDAQHLLAGARNVSATNLCEAVTSVYNALHDASRMAEEPMETGLAVTAETETHVTVSLVIEKAQLLNHRQFLEMLLSLTA
jgi:hypothetical protein